jgi:hypothetical protein
MRQPDGWQYFLYDTEFSKPIELELLPYGLSYAKSPITKAAIRFYLGKRLHPTNNIARCYLYMMSMMSFSVNEAKLSYFKPWFNNDCSSIDESLPQLEYGKKYYNCVLNRMQVLTQSGRYR